MNANASMINPSHNHPDKHANEQLLKTAFMSLFNTKNKSSKLQRPQKAGPCIRALINSNKGTQAVSIKLNTRLLSKENKIASPFHSSLPPIQATPLALYQSHSKSPMKKKVLKQKKPSQLKYVSSKGLSPLNNNETSGTTSAEEKNVKLSYMSILYELQKAAVMIQKHWKGLSMRRRLMSMLKESKPIDSNTRLKLFLDVNDNKASSLRTLSNVSQVSINTQDLNYASSDNEDYVDSDDYF